MSLSINNNLAALKALGVKQNTSANNIANSETEEFKKSRTVLAEGSSGSITAKTQPVNTPGTLINRPDGSVTETSNVDPATEMTDMISTRHAYQANIKALQAGEEMEKTTLDLIG